LLAARAAVSGNPVRTFDKELNKMCAASLSQQAPLL
jgi:hypothetical protein